jgi:hypothetical protein
MIRVGYGEVTTFRAQLQQVPPQLRLGLSKNIRIAGGRFVTALQSAYSWSTRIPGAVSQRVGFAGGRSGGVTVRIDAKRAPHARPLALPNNGVFNRHPVYGGPAWVNQPMRDSFFPTVRAAEPMVVQQVQTAISDVFRRL